MSGQPPPSVLGVGSLLLLMLLVLTPLGFFVMRLSQDRRAALREFGNLASRYVDDFREKWVRAPNTAEPLLGTSDIQSLADLANSFAVSGIRLFPVGKETIVRLVVSLILPLLPLITLTIVPLRQIVDWLIKLVL